MTLAAHPTWSMRSWQGHEHGVQGREPQPMGWATTVLRIP